MTEKITIHRSTLEQPQEKARIENGGPAFPVSTRPMEDEPGFGHQDGSSTWQYGGMTLREYAAIKLRVPESGIDWLDEMISKSVRDEFAAKAMQGAISSIAYHAKPSASEVAAYAYKVADAMLKAREQ